MLLQWLANGKINPQEGNDAITKLTESRRATHSSNTALCSWHKETHVGHERLDI